MYLFLSCFESSSPLCTATCWNVSFPSVPIPSLKIPLVSDESLFIQVLRPFQIHCGPQGTYEIFPTCHGDRWRFCEAYLPRMNHLSFPLLSYDGLKMSLWIFSLPRAIVRGSSVWDLLNLDSKIHLGALSPPAPDWSGRPYQNLSGIFLGPSLPSFMPTPLFTWNLKQTWVGGEIHSERWYCLFLLFIPKFCVLRLKGHRLL